MPTWSFGMGAPVVLGATFLYGQPDNALSVNARRLQAAVPPPSPPHPSALLPLFVAPLLALAVPALRLLAH